MLKRARAVEHWQLDLMDHAKHTPHLLRTRFSAPWRTGDGWNPHQNWRWLEVALALAASHHEKWSRHPWYPLVMTNIAIENHHFKWENPLLIVIFNSYVKLPEGKFGRWCSESRTKRRLHVTWKRVVKRSASLSSMFKTTANRSRRLYCWGTEWT